MNVNYSQSFQAVASSSSADDTNPVERVVPNSLQESDFTTQGY